MNKYNDYLQLLERTLQETVITDVNGTSYEWEIGFQSVMDLFSNTKKERKKVFFAGNGGSSAIAVHMTADFMKNGGMRTVSLHDSAVITCYGNDYGYEQVFAGPLSFLGEAGDLLVTISSSGNSRNIINAIDIARSANMNVLTLSGFGPDNQCRTRGDMNIYVPIEHYGIVESIHNLLLQQIVDELC